jgi:Spy/CpxP family protein refolding chaperone
MKKVAFALVVLAVLAVVTTGVWAQASKPTPKPVLVARVDEMKTVLKLTDEQVKKMMDLIADTEKAKNTLATDFTPVKAEYDKAVAANDQAAVKAATDKWTDLYKKQAEINTKGGADINSILTPAQLTQWLDHKYLNPILVRYEKAGLTDDQLTKVMSEFKKCMSEGNPDDPMFQYQLGAKLGKIIDKQILTDDQRVKMLLDPALAQYKAMNLTDAQVAKIKDQLQTLVKGSGPDEPMYMIGSKLHAFIQKDVLTDEQREKSVLDPILAYYKKADLTNDQVAKIKAEFARLTKEAKPGDPPYVITMKLSSFIPKDVLTDDQRVKMGFKAP